MLKQRISILLLASALTSGTALAQTSTQPLTAPAQDHLLTSNLTGSTVYGANAENIGSIKDVLIDRSGNVAAVVVGVGGFLGIGEKNVAIPFSALDVVAQQSGPTTTGTEKSSMRPDRVVLKGMTKADLEAAPAFRSSETMGRGTTGPAKTTPSPTAPANK